MSGGTGRAALTVVGQVVGAYFGGAFGSAIGGAIGGFIGGELWPEQLEGPKLDGLQVTSSAYGAPIPSIYGAIRCGGNIFFASEIRETDTTEREGKGSGPEVTLHSYSLDLAIGFCDGPIVGFRKIWADQKLIFDLGDDDDIGAIYASYEVDGIRFYNGSETQLPDPTIEAELGVGNTPAYRGLAYLMFPDFQLADYGNRVPNITAEIIGQGTIDPTPRALFGVTLGLDLAGPPNGVHVRLAEVSGALVAIAEPEIEPDAVAVRSWSASGNPCREQSPFAYATAQYACHAYIQAHVGHTAGLCTYAGPFTENDPFRLDDDTYQCRASLPGFPNITVGSATAHVHQSARSWIVSLDGGNSYRTEPVRYWPQNSLEFDFSYMSLLIWPKINDTTYVPVYVFLLTPPPNTAANCALTEVGHAYFDEGGFLTSSAETRRAFSEVLTDGYNFLFGIVPCVDRQHVFGLYAVADAGDDPTYWVLWRYREDDGFIEVRRGTVDPTAGFVRAGGSMRSRDGGFQAFCAGMMESDLEHVWYIDGAAMTCSVNKINGDGVLEELGLMVTTGVSPTPSGSLSVYADNAFCWLYNDNKLYGFTRAPSIEQDATLDGVVEDICVKAGLGASDIDVTDLASVPVRGYLRSPRMNGRAALEPLMTAYAFDAVESDLKIKFRLRNANSIVTMLGDDLGASTSIDDSKPLVETERTQESELPQSIDVSYMAVDADYQIGTQLVKRIATDSVDQQSLRLAFALEDQEAAEIAARMLYEIWIARNVRKWATTIKYAKYEPTDVVTINAENASYKARVIDKRESGNLIEWMGLDVDAAAFNPTATAQPVFPSDPISQRVTLTDTFAADLPPLREIDFGSTGYYAGASGYQAPTWPGAAIFRRPAGSAEYSQELLALTQSTLGGTVGTLGAWGDLIDGGFAYRGYSPDLVNAVEVVLNAGTLSSVTHAQFMNLEQTALIGSEIIAYRDAVLVADNRYRLSCLLRGLLGTEWYASLPPATRSGPLTLNLDGTLTTHDISEIDGHRAGDRFVKLSATTLQRFRPGSATAPIQGIIKGVTIGTTLASTEAKTLLQTWASLVPPHPVHVHAYKSGTMLAVDFDRRTFVGGGWDDGRDVSLDPTHQEYLVHIQNPVAPLIQANFVVSGTPPFLINDPLITTVLNGGTSLWVFAAATPRQFPGLGALGAVGYPSSNHRHWSRQVAVTWA